MGKKTELIILGVLIIIGYGGMYVLHLIHKINAKKTKKEIAKIVQKYREQEWSEINE